MNPCRGFKIPSKITQYLEYSKIRLRKCFRNKNYGSGRSMNGRSAAFLIRCPYVNPSKEDVSEGRSNEVSDARNQEKRRETYCLLQVPTYPIA